MLIKSLTLYPRLVIWLWGASEAAAAVLECLAAAAAVEADGSNDNMPGRAGVCEEDMSVMGRVGSMGTDRETGVMTLL